MRVCFIDVVLFFFLPSYLPARLFFLVSEYPTCLFSAYLSLLLFPFLAFYPFLLFNVHASACAGSARHATLAFNQP